MPHLIGCGSEFYSHGMARYAIIVLILPTHLIVRENRNDMYIVATAGHEPCNHDNGCSFSFVLNEILQHSPATPLGFDVTPHAMLWAI